MTLKFTQEKKSIDVSNKEHEEVHEEEPSNTATGKNKTDHESPKAKKKRKRKW
jgi:hypothetical protein